MGTYIPFSNDKGAELIDVIDEGVDKLVESLNDLTEVHKRFLRGKFWAYNEELGEYDNDSIAAWFEKQRDSKLYSLRIPKSNAVACTKLNDNAGMAVPTPSTNATPGTDPYYGIGPFIYVTVNATVDPDGTPHILAKEGDTNFSSTPEVGDVFIMTPVLWWQYYDQDDDNCILAVSDSSHSGLELQPGARFVSGDIKGFMLYGKYPISIDASGKPRSISGVNGAKIANRTISHNSLITLCDTANTGYSGLNTADVWYIKVMFMLKYATKNSQSVFAGCTDWNKATELWIHPTASESGVTRVCVPAATAARFPIGSCAMLGTGDATSNDRSNANNYNIFDNLKVVSKTAKDSDNVYLNFETDTTFDVSTDDRFTSSPWHPGACDHVIGDGSPYNPTSGIEPFVMQGIELGHGLYEVYGNVIAQNTGDGWKCYVNKDTKQEKTAITDYHKYDGDLPTNSTDGWKYGSYPVKGCGNLLQDTGMAGSTSTGMCDGEYTNKIETTGQHEVLVFGGLYSGANAGLWHLSSNISLSYAYWYIGSRLSVNGRSGGES